MQYITENNLGEFQELAFHATFEAAFAHATECLKEHKSDKKIDIFVVGDITTPHATIYGSDDKFRVTHVVDSVETIVGHYPRLSTANRIALDMLRISNGPATVLVSRQDNMIAYNRI